MIKDENFVQIQGWMINKLNLKGNELIVFATIYGFTQDGVQWFEGSRQYLADWCNSTKQGVQKNLKTLVDKDLLLKEDVIVNKVKFCKYKANLNSLYVNNKVDCPINKVDYPPVNKVDYPSKQSLPNNIDNNINLNNINKESKKEKKQSFDDLIDSYTLDSELRKELKNHLATRKAKKATLTNRAIELSLKKLDDLVKEAPVNIQEQMKLKIVQQSIERGWVGFFEVKETTQWQQPKNKGGNPFFDLLKEEGKM